MGVMFSMAIILITIIMASGLGTILMTIHTSKVALLNTPTILVVLSVYLACLFTVSGFLALSLLAQL